MVQFSNLPTASGQMGINGFQFGPSCNAGMNGQFFSSKAPASFSAFRRESVN